MGGVGLMEERSEAQVLLSGDMRGWNFDEDVGLGGVRREMVWIVLTLERLVRVVRI